MLNDFAILIVDDESDIREIFNEELTERGATVYEASSCAAALKILTETYIDIVLTDVKMPDGDGVELVKSMDKLAYTPSYVFFLTGGSTYKREYLLSLGAREVFLKPIDWKMVTDAIVKICIPIVRGEKTT